MEEEEKKKNKKNNKHIDNLECLPTRGPEKKNPCPDWAYS